MTCPEEHICSPFFLNPGQMSQVIPEVGKPSTLQRPHQFGSGLEEMCRSEIGHRSSRAAKCSKQEVCITGITRPMDFAGASWVMEPC